MKNNFEFEICFEIRFQIFWIDSDKYIFLPKFVVLTLFTYLGHIITRSQKMGWNEKNFEFRYFVLKYVLQHLKSHLWDSMKNFKIGWNVLMFRKIFKNIWNFSKRDPKFPFHPVRYFKPNNTHINQFYGHFKKKLKKLMKDW